MTTLLRTLLLFLWALVWWQDYPYVVECDDEVLDMYGKLGKA